jgi:hypothetical protein
MLRRKFFIAYTCSWVILIIIGISLNNINIIKNFIILKFLIFSIAIATLSWFLYKQIPKINNINVPREKIALIIFAFEAGYMFLRGMIPDEALPHTQIMGLLLRYLYSLIILSILFKATKADDCKNGENIIDSKKE